MDQMCCEDNTIHCIICEIAPNQENVVALETDVAEVRQRLSETQQIYREVCALLFFRYGETPTANRLYQLVRKGSMSAPAKALRDFWAEMREKTRVDVGQPDLPREVATAAGELAANLWRLSMDEANGSLAAFRLDAERAVQTAQQQVREAQARSDSASKALDEATLTLNTERQRIAALESQLAAQQAANATLREQLAGARSEASTTNSALADARRDFSVELEKLRESAAHNEQRLAAAERRALLEIETERTAASRARKELQQANERNGALEAAHRLERDALRDELAGTKTLLAASESRRGELEQRLEQKDRELARAIDTGADLRRRIESLSGKLATSRDHLPSLGRPPRRQAQSARPDARTIKFPVTPLQRKS
ncbi:DNA-binding protein [Paraburkholderia sp. 32]|uniref:DNA-binding protein n=1 Tax=Paraburkholderia sp. 32 TaxID=2991057 RepID=UPI003D1F3C54